MLNYYLDVDGSILTKDLRETWGLHAFLTHLFATGNVLWLTTNCRYEDCKSVQTHLRRFLQPKNFELICQIRGTRWQTLKTEAINYQKPFYWFDDYLLEAEKVVLKNNGCFDRWVMIDLVGSHHNICEAVSKHPGLNIPAS